MTLSRPLAAEPTDIGASLDVFAARLAHERRERRSLPDPARVETWADDLVDVLFGRRCQTPVPGASSFLARLEASAAELASLLWPVRDDLAGTPEVVTGQFFGELPSIRDRLVRDAAAIDAGDPAARDIDEVVVAYPGFLALAHHRLAHALEEIGVPLVPRILAEIAHRRTGIDIHPSASLGCPIVIDHGTGIVIGETAVLGDRVKLYQGVTLGALSVDKSLASRKRHPTIEDDVVIYANATILGGSTVVGRGSVIGGNVWLTESVPAESVVHHRSEVRVRPARRAGEPALDFVI